MLSDLIAQHVLEPAIRARILKRTRSILEVNYRIVSDWLRGHGEVFEVVTPRAGAIAFVRYHLPLDSVEFIERVRREQSVLLIPGAHFGFEGYFRIGYGNESEYLSAALGRVSNWIADVFTSFGAKSG
jgi:aspartate/methionine/tyrosine aminotransferase